MKILVYLLSVQQMMRQSFLFQNILYLLDLVIELSPLFRVVGNKSTLSCFLSDNDKGTNLGIGSALVIPKIALSQEFHPWRDVVMKSLTTEDVLLLQGIALTKCLENMIQHVHEGIVLVGISTILLHGVLYLEDRTVVASLAIQHGIDNSATCIGNVLDARKKSVQCVFPNAHTDGDSV